MKTICYRKDVLLFILAGMFIFLQVMLFCPQPALASDIRLAGEDRYRTAVAISAQGWQSSDYALIVRGDDFADALCAGPLASKFKAPILFTEKYSLNTYTLQELQRLNVKNVIIIGGYGVVSGYIDQNLYSAGILNVERIYGNDRYETSVEIAKRLGSKEVALTNAGQYADALSISAVAAVKGFSILLTSPGSLPEVVRQHLSNYRIERTYLIGGEDVISKEIEKQLRVPVRLAGNNRYETNAKILDKFAGDLDFQRIMIAAGEGKSTYTDSLAGVALAAKTTSPLILSGTKLDDSTKKFLEKKITVASKMIILGGIQAIPPSVAEELSQCIDRVNQSVFQQMGTYGPSEGTATISGSLVIDYPGIIVQNTVIEGDLLLKEGIGGGSIELKNVTVKGRITIRGGGSIIGENLTGKEVVTDSPYNRNTIFRLTGKSKADSVQIESNTTLDVSENTSGGIEEVSILLGKEVILKGSFTGVSSKANGYSLRLEEADIKTLDAGAGGYIYGSGTIATANINSNGVVIAFYPAVTIVEEGYEVLVAGQLLKEGTTKYTPPVVPKSIPISNLTVTPGNCQASFTFPSPIGATSVTLKQSTNGSTWVNASAGTLKANSTSATAAGLVNGTLYYFKLVIVGGSRAGDSNTVTVTPVNPINDLKGTAGDEQVSFTFSKPEGAGSVILKQSADNGSTWSDSAVVAPLTADSTSAVATGLINGETYKFKLTVIGGSRAGDSNTETVTLPEP